MIILKRSFRPPSKPVLLKQVQCDGCVLAEEWEGPGCGSSRCMDDFCSLLKPRVCFCVSLLTKSVWGRERSHRCVMFAWTPTNSSYTNRQIKATKPAVKDFQHLIQTSVYTISLFNEPAPTLRLRFSRWAGFFEKCFMNCLKTLSWCESSTLSCLLWLYVLQCFKITWAFNWHNINEHANDNMLTAQN